MPPARPAVELGEVCELVMVYELVVLCPVSGALVARYRVSAEARRIAQRLARKEKARGMRVLVRLVEWAP